MTARAQRLRWAGWGFFALWLLVAVHPVHRATWALEAIPLLAVPVVLHHNQRLPLSTRAWVYVILFSTLHLIGSWYTYARMPLGVWARDAFELSRNPYDRLVHGLFGFFFVLPARELCLPRRDTSTWRPLLFALCIVSTVSMLYEIVEWLLASLVGSATGQSFLATQGDEWDPQKDMAMAWVGSVAAVLVERWRARAPQPSPAEGVKLLRPRAHGL